METLVQLQFKQRLIAAGRKTIPPAELTKRLKALHTELAELDQERVDVHSLDSVTQDLISPALTAHKDRGVQILTACCIADVLRLYAPEAPYDERQLHAIFDFFLAQLAHLAQPDDPHAALYFYLLESLSTVKSVVLAVDLDRPEELVTEFFRLFFDVIRPDQSRNLQLCMMDILQQLVEEAPTVPQEVVDIILAQFLKKRQTANPPAYQLACDLCNAATDRLQKYVCQYFTDVIVTASQTTARPDSADDAHGSLSDRLSDFKTAHYLIKELNRACPGLLLNVIPQLEEELTLDDVHLRTLATSVLGDMIAERGHALVRRYPSAWRAWIQRKNDKSHQVRGLWAELAVNLYQAQPQLGRDLNESVLAKLADPEERVRSAICQALGQLDYETLAYSLLDPQIITELGHRCRDKKPTVRQKAIQALSRMFDMAYPAIAARDPAALVRFSQIPTMVLNPLYTNDAELTDAVEQSLVGTILNPTTQLDDRQRTQRLLITLSFLDARAFNAFRSILLRQAATRRDMQAFLDCCDQYNTVSGPQDDSAQETTMLTLLNQLTRRLASKLPDPARHVQQLFNFANLHDNRAHRLIRDIMELQQGYQSVTKAQRKALSRLASLSPGVAGTFTILLRRVGLSVVNSATIPPLMDVIREASKAPALPAPAADSEPATQPSALGALSQRGSQLSLTDPSATPPTTTAWTAHDLVGPAQQLLDAVSTVFPGLYKQHLADLFQLLQPTETEASLPGALEHGLQALAQYARKFPADLPAGEQTTAQLHALVLGDAVPQAKYAAVVLAHAHEGPQPCSAVLRELVAALPRDTNHAEWATPAVVAHLTALAQLARYQPQAFSEHSEEVVGFVVKQVLLRELPPAQRSKQALNRDWVEPHELDATAQCKVVALKVLTNRLLGLLPSQHSAAQAQALAKPVMAMLQQLVTHEGELLPAKSTPAAVRSYLRLTAAKCMLQLATQHRYDARITVSQMEQLGLMVQDSCFQVRFAFVTKLIKHLSQFQVPTRYLACLFLVAFDPEPDMKTTVRAFVKRQLALPAVRDQHSTLYENMVTRLIHLLAHHPDFKPADDELVLFSRYLEFYLDLVASADNVSLIFYLASQVKTVGDASLGRYDPGQTLPARAEYIYVLSDLCQFILQEKCHSHQWSLPSFPGTAPLPPDLYFPLESDQAMALIAKKSYITSGFIRQRTAAGHAGQGTRRHAQRHEPRATATPRKQRRAAKGSRSSSDGEGESDAETRHARTPSKRRRRQASTSTTPSKSVRSTAATPVRRNTPRATRSARAGQYHDDAHSTASDGSA